MSVSLEASRPYYNDVVVNHQGQLSEQFSKFLDDIIRKCSEQEQQIQALTSEIDDINAFLGR